MARSVIAHVVCAVLLLATQVFAKTERMPLPQQLMQAKRIYIDNRSGFAAIGDKAFDELKKWGRFEIVDSAEKADVVLLISAQEYISGYASSSYQNTTASVNGGYVNANTSGNSNSRAVTSGTTYI